MRRPIDIQLSVISDFQALVALEPPTDAPVLLGTACVLGGSVAGLLAARVLAGYSRDVVIVERDQIPPFPTARPGTPHDRQEHTLLPAGHRWIERWLPGFTADAVAAGAPWRMCRTPSSRLTGNVRHTAGQTINCWARAVPCSKPVCVSLSWHCPTCRWPPGEQQV